MFRSAHYDTAFIEELDDCVEDLFFLFEDNKLEFHPFFLDASGRNSQDPFSRQRNAARFSNV